MAKDFIFEFTDRRRIPPEYRCLTCGPVVDEMACIWDDTQGSLIHVPRLKYEEGTALDLTICGLVDEVRPAYFEGDPVPVRRDEILTRFERVVE